MTPRLVLTGLGITILAACVLEPDVGPLLVGSCENADSNPGTSVSFSHDIRPLIFRASRGCGCHVPSAPGPKDGLQLGGLDLSSFASLRAGGFDSGSRVVVAGEPCASIMYQKLGVSPPFGSRMPLNGPPFWSRDELQLLHDWIAEGASDN